MNALTIVPLAMTPEMQRIVVLAVLVLLGLGMVAAALVFAYSIWKQRKYNTTALPSLGGETVTQDEDEEEDTSAFALDLVKADPISKGAFATRLDEDAAFIGMTPHSELVGQNPVAETPRARPEAALPMLPGMAPRDDLDEVTPRAPLAIPGLPQKDFKKMELGGAEPDEFPEWQSSGNYELTPELEAAASPRAARDLDDDEDLDFTPVMDKEQATPEVVRESRRLGLPTVDKINPVISSSDED